WIQPTYTGLSARNCLGLVGNVDPGCTPQVGGPIGTLPWYSENGLVSDGDPGLAFGPKPDSTGHFAWSNGSRLYYSNLTSNLGNTKKDETFKGAEAIAVSRIDGAPDLTPAIVSDKNNWKVPVLVSKQSSTTFSDKEQIWADNAESSPFFGNCYLCWASFRSLSNGQGSHILIKSFDGGKSWTKPQNIGLAVDTCFAVQFDGTDFRCVEDGVAGARDDLGSAPSIDIANGAPTGASATDEIVRTWVDGRDGLDHEHV